MVQRAGAAVMLLAASVTSASAQTIAITGGKVYPVSGAPIENGTVLIRDGRIVAVGANVTVPGDAQRVDATGKWVTPGLFNAATQLGLIEIGQVSNTRDMTARGEDGIAAAFRAWEGFNPMSVLLAPARDEGITTVLVHPTGGLIWGQAAILDLVPGVPTSEMLRKAPVAMVGQLGSPGQASTGARGELLLRMRELFEDTRAYSRRRADFERAETREFAASRLDLEAMIPVLEGRQPLILAVDKASDIESALSLAKEFKLRIMIAGGAEAWMVAKQLAEAKVPVLSGAMQNIPGSFSTLGVRQENLALLQAAGVRVIIIGSGNDPDAFNVRNLKQDAGIAVAYGLSWDNALRAVTLTPAEVFGVDDRIGSLATGKDANVVVWSGDPFEFSTRVERVFVKGREYTEPNRQELLTERYKTLPPKFRMPATP